MSFSTTVIGYTRVGSSQTLPTATGCAVVLCNQVDTMDHERQATYRSVVSTHFQAAVETRPDIAVAAII